MSAPLSAEPLPALPEALRADWVAIGAVNADGTESVANCTGALIAADVVLTAAHCVGGVSGSNSARAFVIGWPGQPTHKIYRSRQIEVYPPYSFASGIFRYSIDMALIFLDQSVPKDVATPIALSSADDPSGPFALLGYHRMQPGTLNGRFDCAKRDTAQSEFLLDCPVVAGNSGSPVMALVGAEWQIIGVTTARIGHETALIAPINQWVRDQLATQ